MATALCIIYTQHLWSNPKIKENVSQSSKDHDVEIIFTSWPDLLTWHKSRRFRCAKRDAIWLQSLKPRFRIHTYGTMHTFFAEVGACFIVMRNVAWRRFAYCNENGVRPYVSSGYPWHLTRPSRPHLRHLLGQPTIISATKRPSVMLLGLVWKLCSIPVDRTIYITLVDVEIVSFSYIYFTVSVFDAI